MAASTPNSNELYAAYRTEVHCHRIAPSLRTGILVVLALNTSFIAFDLSAFREQFHALLCVRIATDLVLLSIYWALIPRWPLVAAFAGCFATGGSLLSVIYRSGGALSEYSPGLMLLFVGMPVLIPFSAGQATWIVSLLFVTYAAPPFLSSDPIPWREYVLHICFPLAAGVECIASTALLDGIRFSDYRQRLELERARDELKELDRAKSRFTANIHHELRTPLTLVLSPIEAMLGGEFGEMGEGPRHYLHTMKVNALRLLKLINNLLDVAKAESRQLSLRRRIVNLGSLLGEVVIGARPMAERKGISLQTSGLESVRTIHADPDALEKIVMNLIGNAIKFTDPGGSITVRTESKGGGVQITVSDTGIGIPPEQLERIFDRFAQVDTSATRKYEGTGIGLSLVKELAELHGGRAWAESEGVGHGAQFHVTLPPGEEDEALEEEILQSDSGRSEALGRSLGALEAELNISTGSGGSHDDSGYRHADLEHTVTRWEGTRSERLEIAPIESDSAEIVVAEDNAEMRRLLAHLLSREFRVREARNGREALEAVREQVPDLVLTDVMMPEMSGTDLCRELKSAPETASIPVVLVTSKAEREMKVMGLELGADDYVTKPFHPRELLARVRSLVRLHRLQAQLAKQNRELEEANDELASTLEDLKAAEVQLVQSERLAAVGELAAGVAHEVNNPVNFALNAVRMLKSHVEGLARTVARIESLDPRVSSGLPGQAEELKGHSEVETVQLAQEVVELVEIATEGLERTQRLVGDLKDLAGPQKTHHAPIDVERCVRSTVQLLRHSLEHAGVSVDLQMESNLPRVRGDAGALSQVFLNLLKNAGEALETRGGRIEVGARREGTTVVVEIRDDGPGVAAEVRTRLFEPFVSTKDAGRGSGLGLSISHRIVTEHGGTLELRSEPGEGAAFMIRLPAEERDAA